MMCTEIETNCDVALDNGPSDRSEALSKSHHYKATFTG